MNRSLQRIPYLLHVLTKVPSKENTFLMTVAVEAKVVVATGSHLGRIMTLNSTKEESTKKEHILTALFYQTPIPSHNSNNNTPSTRILVHGLLVIVTYHDPTHQGALPHTVRLLTHVLCKPTHFFFQLFRATTSNSLQTRFNRVMKDWPDK